MPAAPSRKVVRMNLEEIDMVLSVIRNKSFSLAAQELSYSQPTISKHIDSLEKELRIKLFNRKTRANRAHARRGAARALFRGSTAGDEETDE